MAMRKTTIQVVGVALSALNVAIPLWLNAQQLLPLWQWQLHAIIGFLAFAGFMIWIVYDKQYFINRLQSGRPNIILSDRITSEHINFKDRCEFNVILNILFRNIGTKPAFQLSINIGFAPTNKPHDFRMSKEKTIANPIAPNSNLKFNRMINIKQQYTLIGDDMQFSVYQDWLIYCAIKYSDSSTTGRWYEEKWFLYYMFPCNHLDHASIKQKEMLEPYIIDAYAKLPS